jgi:hypothetical protein
MLEKLTPGIGPKAASAATTDSQLRLSLELLGGVGGSKLTTMRVLRVSDIAANNRVGTRGGSHKEGKQA